MYLIEAGVSAIIGCWLLLLPFDMCCYDCGADVVATVADGIAICNDWCDFMCQILLPMPHILVGADGFSSMVQFGCYQDT